MKILGNGYITADGKAFRSRTRDELIHECYSIIDSAICGGSTGMENAARRLADLLIDLTGNQGVVRVESETK